MSNLDRFFPDLGTMPGLSGGEKQQTATSTPVKTHEHFLGKLMAKEAPKQEAPTPKPKVNKESTPAQVFGQSEKSIVYTFKDSGNSLYPEVTPVTVYKCEPLPIDPVPSAQRVCSNSEYICYGMKQGLRVIHKQSVKNVLIKCHQAAMVQAQFSPMHPGVLATTALDQRAVITRLKYEEVLMYRDELKFSAPAVIRTLKWHPVEESLVLMVAGDIAYFVFVNNDLTIKQSASSSDLDLGDVCDLKIQTRGEAISEVDFNMSGDTLATANGSKVKLWSVNVASRETNLMHAFLAHDGGLVTNVFFIDRNHLLTCTDRNAKFRVWDLKDKPTMKQQLIVDGMNTTDANYHSIVRMSPQHSCFIVADPCASRVICVSMTEELMVGNVAQIAEDSPILSFEISETKTNDQVSLLCMRREGIDYQVLKLPHVVYKPKPKPQQRQQPRAIQKPAAETANPLLPLPPLPVINNPEPKLTAKPQLAPPKLPAPKSKASSQPVPRQVASKPLGAQSGADGKSEAKGTEVVSGDNDLFARLEQQAARRAKRDTEQQKMLLKALSDSLNQIPESVEETVKDLLEDGAFKQDIASAVAKQMDLSVSKRVGEIASKLQRPLVEAFTKTMQSAFLPAFEASCQNMTRQFTQHLQETNTLSREIQQMKAAQQEINRKLDKVLKSGNSEVSTGSKQERNLSPEEQVNHWITQKDYENAFVSALHANDATLIDYVCSKVNSKELFAISPLPISQRVLLSLLQQLSLDLGVNSGQKLLWIRDIAMALDKNDPSVGLHVPRVLEHVKSALQSHKTTLGVSGHPSFGEYKLCCLVVDNL